MSSTLYDREIANLGTVEKKKRKSIWLIVGIILGVLVLSVIILVIILVKKKKSKLDDDKSSQEISDGTISNIAFDNPIDNNSIQGNNTYESFDNPLNESKMSNDPFDQEFDEDI